MGRLFKAARRRGSDSSLHLTVLRPGDWYLISRYGCKTGRRQISEVLQGDVQVLGGVQKEGANDNGDEPARFSSYLAVGLRLLHRF